MSDDKRPTTLAIVGTTACGKSALALALARRFGDVELISVDSMQVYRGMDIGTAKPSRAEQAQVRHHLIDIVEPSAEFSVAEFQASARRARREIAAANQRPILVGGTGLYLRAVVDDLDIPGRFPEVRLELEANGDTRSLHRQLVRIDPLAASRMEPDNRRRVLRALEVTLGSGRRFSEYGPGMDATPDAHNVKIVGLAMEPKLNAERIEARYQQQLAEGFLDEVDRLLDAPDPLSKTATQALGYRELFAYRRGQVSLDEALDQAIRRTRKFARRQRSWFRRDSRIHWFETDGDIDSLVDETDQFISQEMNWG